MFEILAKNLTHSHILELHHYQSMLLSERMEEQTIETVPQWFSTFSRTIQKLINYEFKTLYNQHSKLMNLIHICKLQRQEATSLHKTLAKSMAKLVPKFEEKN